MHFVVQGHALELQNATANLCINFKIPIQKFMKYQQFKDHLKSLKIKNPVILLEGKREVKKEDEPFLLNLGKKLAEELPDCFFGNGNAKGADELFAQGVSLVAPERLQLILPYRTHRKENIKNSAYTCSLDDVNIALEPELVYQTKETTKIDNALIDSYINGKKNYLTVKVPYLMRDTLKVIGSNTLNLDKASIGIFYDDIENPGSGGTGFTMRVCEKNGVWVITQESWGEWVK